MFNVKWEQDKEYTDPETGAPNSPDADTSLDNKDNYTYTNTVATKPLLEHPMFKTLVNDAEQMTAVDYVKSARCKLDNIKAGQNLTRVSEEDTEFKMIYLMDITVKYLNFWQQGIESYYIPTASYDINDNILPDEILVTLIDGKPMMQTSETTSLDGRGTTTTTKSFSTFNNEVVFIW